MDVSIDDRVLREKVFSHLSRDELQKALSEVQLLIRPANDVAFHTLDERYRSIRRFLPDMLKHLHFGATPQEKRWLQDSTG